MQKRLGIGPVVSITFVAALLLAGVLVAARQRDAANQPTAPVEKSGTNESNSRSRGPSTPNNPEEAALGREIDKAIDEGESRQARWGVFVTALNDGRVIYSRNSASLFTPASNMKIYTTAAALDMLGADYRWRTSVYAVNDADGGGRIDGDLILYGRGAPDLISSRRGGFPSLAELADQLYQRGVRSVGGSIIGDESYFRGEMYGDGWQWNDLQWYFGAEPSALSIDANAVAVTITPGHKVGGPAELELKPQTDHLHVTNNTTTGERGVQTTIGINRGLSNNDIRIWGEFPLGGRAFGAYLSVAQPALWAAEQFKQALTARGIVVDGDATSRDFRVAEKQQFNPQSAAELAHVDSETLGEIVRATNKESINLNAELILRTLGKERGPIAPDPDPRRMKQRGDDEAGAAVIKGWLDRLGVATGNLSLRDGSGLSRLDLVTPESTVEMLSAASRTGWFTVFHDSLPVAGKDGTLKPRLLPATGRISAKTGSLTFDHSLSGYVTTKNNRVFAFSIFCNDETRDYVAVRTIDRIAALLASYD